MNIWNWLKRVLSGRRAGAGRSPFPPGRGPSRLVVMRHGEKTGDKADHHLSKKGELRAADLVRYIPERIGKPDFLIAASRNPHSDRPVDTLRPLAAAFGLPIIDHIRDEDTSGVVDLLSDRSEFAGKLGVVAWRHSDLPDLIAALGAADGTFPEKWPEDQYDLLIEIDYRRGDVPSVSRHMHVV